jgi:hypothetical protein
MATIRVGIEINKGRHGVPLSKLSEIVGTAEAFLAMLSEDIDLPVAPDSWIGLDFHNGSLTFTAEKKEPATVPELKAFNSAFMSILDQEPAPSLRRATVAKYADIAKPIGPDEEVGFHLYEPEPDDSSSTGMREIGISVTPDLVAPLRSYALTKAKAEAIQSEVQGKVRAYGSLQGRIHSLFLASNPPYFHLRELSSGSLIRCTFRADKYAEIAAALQTKNAIIHVYGYTTTDLVQRKLEEMATDKVVLAPVLTDEDFAKLFGAAPGFTGKLTTQEFMNRTRGRVN